MAVALAAAAPAGAAAPADVRTMNAEADQHATVGQRHLDGARYQDAIVEFRRAYELRADPRFLYDIGEAYRRLGVIDRALFFYDRYLATAGEAPDRDEVERKIAELERARSRSAAAAAGAPALANLSHDVRITAVDGPPPEPRAAAPWRRWWFWTAVGAAVIAGAVTAALVGGQGGGAATPTELGDKRFF